MPQPFTLNLKRKSGAWKEIFYQELQFICEEDDYFAQLCRLPGVDPSYLTVTVFDDGNNAPRNQYKATPTSLAIDLGYTVLHIRAPKDIIKLICDTEPNLIDDYLYDDIEDGDDVAYCNKFMSDDDTPDVLQIYSSGYSFIKQFAIWNILHHKVSYIEMDEHGRITVE